MRVPFNQQHLTTGDIATVNDPSPMSIQSLAAGLVSPYAQNVGVIIEVDDRQSPLISGSKTLYGGQYQYVQFTSVTGVAFGCLAFWDTFANNAPNKYVVTTVATATNITQVAGIVLNASMTASNYGWIQIIGIANVLYKTSPTDTTIGDIVFSNVAPANTADANTEASVTVRQLSKRIGVAYTIPVTAATGLVWLQPGGALVVNE